MPRSILNSQSVRNEASGEERDRADSPEQRSRSSQPQAEGWFYGTHELLDALPKAWTRGLLYVLIGFTVLVLPWAIFSKVDETGSARGRLEPKARTVRLDAPVAGTVAVIKVKEGQSVSAGQKLIELESEVTRADLQQAEAKLAGLSDRRTQLELIKTQLAAVTTNQKLQNQSQQAVQLAQIRQTQEQLALNQSTSLSSEELLSKDQDRVSRFQKLKDEGVISGTQLEDAERALIESQQRLKKNQSDIQQSQSELEKQQSTYEKGQQEGALSLVENEKRIQELQAQMTDVDSEIAQIKNQIQSLQFQLQQRILNAPIAGTVFQLPIKSAGTVVQPGALVAQIAPKDVPLVLRAKMSSQESGFLRVGLPVKLKFDAYPFQDYGIVEGRLSWISPDSKVQETQQGSVEVFELEITLDRSSIQTANRQIALTPGQTASAEVIIRQRRIIDFILDPFKKLQAGGLKL